MRTPAREDGRKVENYFVCGEVSYEEATLQSRHDLNSDIVSAGFGPCLAEPKFKAA